MAIWWRPLLYFLIYRFLLSHISLLSRLLVARILILQSYLRGGFRAGGSLPSPRIHVSGCITREAMRLAMLVGIEPTISGVTSLRDNHLRYSTIGLAYPDTRLPISAPQSTRTPYGTRCKQGMELDLFVYLRDSISSLEVG